jgi:hypothetical protein
MVLSSLTESAPSHCKLAGARLGGLCHFCAWLNQVARYFFLMRQDLPHWPELLNPGKVRSAPYRFGKLAPEPEPELNPWPEQGIASRPKRLG